MGLSPIGGDRVERIDPDPADRTLRATQFVAGWSDVLRPRLAFGAAGG